MKKRRPAPPLPPGKFGLLYADPPWQYDFSLTSNREIENQYPTLTCQEICELTVGGRWVGDLAGEVACLFLWATNPKLREALAVVEAWGFTYLTNMVWVKDKIGMGYWARQRHELLLIARKGDFPPPEEDVRPDSVIEAPRLAHSAKPEAVYELLESLFAETRKIEVFGRKQREGWSVWGNECHS